MALVARFPLKPNQILPILLRSIHSSPAIPGSSPATVTFPDATTLPPPDQHPAVLDLSDTDRLFSGVSTASLSRAFAVLSSMSVEPAVDLGIKILRSKGVMESSIGRGIALGLVRATAYEQFCAGEGVEEAVTTLRGLWELGMRGILDYGVEDAVDEESCDRNLAGFLKTIEMTSSLPSDSVSAACVKITAICPNTLLERVSDLLRWKEKDPAFLLPWKSKSLPILSPSSPLYHTPSMPPPLSEAEERDLQLAQQRLSTLCQRCKEANLPLLIDAEYTSVQPAIDYLVYSAALQFNRDDRPIVYGTIQAYLKDSKERLLQVVEAAEKEGISIGLKLVRGAYLTRETELASSFGVASPIHESIGKTHSCYDDCVSFMLERIVKGSGSVLLATHNVESGRAAATKAEELGIDKGNQNLQFAQLKGMADGLSLALRNAGFQVSKYLPFGPVDQVIPYLLRRAEENRGFLSTSKLDRQLIRTELKRRLNTAVLGR